MRDENDDEERLGASRTGRERVLVDMYQTEDETSLSRTDASLFDS